MNITIREVYDVFVNDAYHRSFDTTEQCHEYEKRVREKLLKEGTKKAPRIKFVKVKRGYVEL